MIYSRENGSQDVNTRRVRVTRGGDTGGSGDQVGGAHWSMVTHRHANWETETRPEHREPERRWITELWIMDQGGDMRHTENVEETR